MGTMNQVATAHGFLCDVLDLNICCTLLPRVVQQCIAPKLLPKSIQHPWVLPSRDKGAPSPAALLPVFDFWDVQVLQWRLNVTVH